MIFFYRFLSVFGNNTYEIESWGQQFWHGLSWDNAEITIVGNYLFFVLCLDATDLKLSQLI